jgi:hypothetical protein
MNNMIEETLLEFKKLSEVSKLVALSNIRAVIATEQAIKRQYGLDRQEPPAQAGKTA